jgi:cobaltochelatase CobT
MHLLYSDEAIHREKCPDEPVQRLIFEMLEQLRVETQVLNRFPGVKANLYYRFRAWSLQFHADGLADTQLGLLIYTIAQIVWSRLTGNPTLEETDDLIEVTRGTIAPVIGSEIASLRRDRNDQAAYAEHALLIAQIVENSLRAGDQDSTHKTSAVDIEKDLRRIALALDFTDEAEDDNIATVVTGTSKVLEDAAQGYRIYTRAYDSEFKASKMIRDAELREFRERIDQLIKAQGINIPRLARHISELLATPRRDGWLYGEEEGIIDGRRLTQLVTTPSERRLFRKEQYLFKNDCLVSFLIDCSGSMKQHIEYIAMLVDIFSHALDQSHIAVEILGFTTASWNGGRAYKDWQAQGRPLNPGRMNEQQHLIFKDADTSWRKARRDIAALLKTTSFREGIDGEAVDWACQRMRKHGESRKILLVVSDGSPMDSATNLTNDEFYLDNHLKQTIEKNENNTGIEIYGIGVGLSLTPYYKHCLAIDLNESLSNTVFMQVLQMIHHAHRR